jgi:hypothetical protein
MAVLSEIHLVNESVGSLFTVPERDWTEISKRVGQAVLAKDISNRIAQYLPDFPALVTACERWKDHTFPGLVVEATNLPGYCSRAREDFSRLQQELAGQDPNRPLPPLLQQEAQTVLARLSESSTPRERASKDLVAELMAFVSVNELIDAKIKSYTDLLGPEWKSIDPSSGAVSRASSLVLGAWVAISSDLSYVVSGRIPITTALLLSLGISSALLAWENLQREAEQFSPIAQGQKKYLNGQWLKGAASVRHAGLE